MDYPKKPSLEVEHVLDTMHTAASEANFSTYLGCFHEDAIFLGTDASERWTKETFTDYVNKRFSDGTGWTYTPINRHIQVSPGGNTAWFDEQLRHERYGAARASGVLLRHESSWKVVQFVLSFPIPNEATEVVLPLIKR